MWCSVGGGDKGVVQCRGGDMECGAVWGRGWRWVLCGGVGCIWWWRLSYAFGISGAAANIVYATCDPTYIVLVKHIGHVGHWSIYN